MPLYDFQCKNGHQQEKIVPMDTQTIECPVCQEPAERTISTRPANFRFNYMAPDA